jgi:ATP-dependent Clp protease ATP-binding subunit ClpX
MSDLIDHNQTEPRREHRYCSFCRKDYQEVGLLAEGPDKVYICYGCVLLLKHVIEEESGLRGLPLVEP